MLLHNDEEVVLLTTLNKKILAVNEVVRSDFLIESSKFFFVKAYAISPFEAKHLVVSAKRSTALAPRA